jgi:phospholipase/carboxylesterase
VGEELAVGGADGETHGTDDDVLPIDATSRRVVPMLERAGYDVRYREFTGGHAVPGDLAAEAVMWFLGEGRCT